MQVMLISVNNPNPKDHNQAEWLVINNNQEKIIPVSDPEKADIIVFIASNYRDPYFRKVINHPLYKKYHRKSVLYHEADRSITVMPTLSPSVERWQFNSKNKWGFHYIAKINSNEFIDSSPVNFKTDRSFLYSFMGSRTHRIRHQIISLCHPKDVFIKDTTGTNAWTLNSSQKIAYKKEFYEVMTESYFVLAPRGIGASSLRLFEAMQMGRVPVILSDQWVKIPEIPWEKFSITIRESEINTMIDILKERRNESVEMGKTARYYWEQFFSPEVSLYRIAAAGKEILRTEYGLIDKFKDYSQFIRSPWHMKNLLRYIIKIKMNFER